MIRIVARTRISAPPERAWAWFVGMDAHYLDWHSEHLMWRTLSGPPLGKGTVVFADEWVGPARLAGRFRIRDVRPGQFFDWEMLFPHSLVGAGGSFALQPSDSGCELVAEVHVGWSVPVAGPALDWLIGRVLPLGELRRHMGEEGENLARLLGGAADASAPAPVAVPPGA